MSESKHENFHKMASACFNFLLLQDKTFLEFLYLLSITLLKSLVISDLCLIFWLMWFFCWVLHFQKQFCWEVLLAENLDCVACHRAQLLHSGYLLIWKFVCSSHLLSHSESLHLLIDELATAAYFEGVNKGGGKLLLSSKPFVVHVCPSILCSCYRNQVFNFWLYNSQFTWKLPS